MSVSSLFIHPSIIPTPVHQFCTYKPSRYSSIHPRLSVLFLVHPFTPKHTSFHMPLLYKSIHLSIRTYCFIPTCISTNTGWCAIISLSLSISEIIDILLCSSFHKWTLQTSPIQSPTYLPIFLLLTCMLLCILDETTRLRFCPPILVLYSSVFLSLATKSL